MSFILTFLGKGGSGRTTMAIATAKKISSIGSRVLLVGQDPTPVLSILWGQSVDSSAREIAPNLEAIQLQGTKLLEQSWEQLKELEAKYLRSPTLKNIYGQELALLPGMDEALALNFIREQDETGKYDAIIYDGLASLNTLRMLGIPDILSWYFRRVRQTLDQSDLVKAISPFVQPVSSAVLTVSWTPDDLASEPNNEANQILERGQAALADANRVASFVVTTNQPAAMAAAKYWWGSAQQVGLTVGGVLLNQARVTEELSAEFNPLPVTSIPTLEAQNWQPLMDALPDFKSVANQAPKPIRIDTLKREVKVFLPGFDKKQVKLSQSGPEITIEAGNQRHNIFLPPPLKGQPVKGAKFQQSYLIISL
jgi:arsenite-transporting ATPase